MSLISTRVKRLTYLSLEGFSLNAFMLMIDNQETKKKKKKKLVSWQKPV